MHFHKDILAAADVCRKGAKYLTSDDTKAVK